MPLLERIDAGFVQLWTYVPVRDCHAFAVLLQHNADPHIKNTDGKTPLDLSDAAAKQVLTGTVRLFHSLLSSAHTTTYYNCISYSSLSCECLYIPVFSRTGSLTCDTSSSSSSIIVSVDSEQ